jgi:hypothetical protein
MCRMTAVEKWPLGEPNVVHAFAATAGAGAVTVHVALSSAKVAGLSALDQTNSGEDRWLEFH